MTLFDYTSPSVALHQSVTDLFNRSLAALTNLVPQGPDFEAAVTSLVAAAESAHVAVDKVPAISPSPVASEGATVDAGAAPVAGPPPAPEAPAPGQIQTAQTVYVPAVASDVTRAEPGQPKPGA